MANDRCGVASWVLDLHHHTASETPSEADEGPADVNAQVNARKCSSAAT